MTLDTLLHASFHSYEYRDEYLVKSIVIGEIKNGDEMLRGHKECEERTDANYSIPYKVLKQSALRK